jgi:hypothetical protein
VAIGYNSIVKWDPSRLNRQLLAAFGQSVGDARRVAQTLNPAPSKIGIAAPSTSPTSAILKSTGRIGHIFELGREGDYIIQPGLKSSKGGQKGVRAGSGNIALKFRDGGFARGAVRGGAMRERPFLRPAAAQWSRVLYKRRASAALRGFIGF